MAVPAGDLLLPAQGGLRPWAASGRAREAGLRLCINPHLASSKCKELSLAINTAARVILGLILSILGAQESCQAAWDLRLCAQEPIRVVIPAHCWLIALVLL